LVLDGLGINIADRKILTKEVNVILNCAASINFDDPLIEAIKINYLGCFKLL
jgi:hypothetical protein